VHKLHIVCFDVPFPADYGGAIDVFYKIRSLAEAGIELYLHCFAYGRPQAPELSALCKEVWYYPRKTGLPGLSFSLPYITNSRRSTALLERLQQIDAPILFEGVHTAYYLNHPSLKTRLKILRNHNVEQLYYKLLAERESSVRKRIFFKLEAERLQVFEAQLQPAQVLMPISAADTLWFQRHYKSKKVIHLPGFHPYTEVVSATGKGSYCLYHGNLSHPENIQAALFLLRNVFRSLDVPLVIAGKSPVPAIREAVEDLPHCRLIADPDSALMDQLIREAQVHVLPTFQDSGMKLKLLYALFAGRHVLVNEKMLAGTGLEQACTIAGSEAAFKELIPQLMSAEFGSAERDRRIALLKVHYDNARNAQCIIDVLKGSAQ